MTQKADPQQLIPAVKLNVWRQDDPHSEAADRDYSLVRLKVLKQAKFTCSYCGFMTVPDRKAEPTSSRASGYLEGHHEDDDHSNNHPDNIKPACPFCHLVFHIGNAGHQRKAKVVYLPWISQADLNLLVITLAVAIHRGGGYGDQAGSLYSWLSNFDGLAVQHYGKAIVDPTNLASALMNLNREGRNLYINRGRALQNLRLLPLPKAFPDAVQWWSDHCFHPGNTWESQWHSIYSQWCSEAYSGS